jgi:hypothetical protein
MTMIMDARIILVPRIVESRCLNVINLGIIEREPRWGYVMIVSWGLFNLIKVGSVFHDPFKRFFSPARLPDKLRNFNFLIIHFSQIR